MVQFKAFFDETYILPACTAYQELPFSTLIAGYERLEQGIIRDVKSIIQFYFAYHDFKFNGTRYYQNNRTFVCLVEFTRVNRELIVLVQDDNLEKNKCSQSIQINHFGIIRRVSLIYPNHLEKHLITLSQLIEKYILTTYSAIESAITDKFEHIADRICKKISKIFNTYLASIGKKHLIDSTKFFIFQQDAGFFYFDKETYSRAITNFKKNQNDLFSPYELSAWLLTSPLPFAKSLSSVSFERNGEVATQQWTKAKFIDEKQFYESASRLYDLKPYSVLSLRRSRNQSYRLSIAFRKVDKRELVPILQDIKHLIINEFDSSTASFSNYIKFFNATKFEEVVVSNPEWFGNFTGTALAAFFKTLKHIH